MRTRILIAVAAILAPSVTVVALTAAPAQSAARVAVSNGQGSAAADPTYATQLTLRGNGFQSIKGGHGGIYVFFGTIRGTWKPSQGGQTGTNYLYVPDSESKNNQGFQRFVAFPGSDTGGAANGGEIKADGTWSTTVTVPGATFNAVDRTGKATKVDCRTATCGIITIGAHGVKNPANETFTEVSFENLYADGEAPPTTGSSQSSSPAPEATTPAPTPAATATAAAPSGPPTLVVDRATAVAGRAMTFNATGLPSGDQVVVSLDDGLAAVGPLSVGPNGQVAGSIKLPADLASGTHVLKLTGSAQSPETTFAVRGAIDEASASTGPARDAITFAALAGVALLGALVFSVLRLRSIRQGARNEA